jgi:23S rRNA pseudouridine1911/1915/1917 synthase
MKPHAVVWAAMSCKLCYRQYSRLVDSAASSFRHVAAEALPSPSIIYSNNHLLVVNKPPGWKSVPDSVSAEMDPKSLISHLQYQRFGGGSSQTFLLPLHRIDQPCSGVLLLSKTRRAASRVQLNWKQVKKLYLCYLDTSASLESLVQASQSPTTKSQTEWMELMGHESQSKKRPRSVIDGVVSQKGWSVMMSPVVVASTVNDIMVPAHGVSRLRSIRWKQLQPNLLAIETNQGSRHMIRALLGMVDCPIAGDLRYGAKNPLPDRSVALHARQLQLPSTLPLGENTQRLFQAPIPERWKTFFGIQEDEMCSQIH